MSAGAYIQYSSIQRSASRMAFAAHRPAPTALYHAWRVPPTDLPPQPCIMHAVQQLPSVALLVTLEPVQLLGIHDIPE